MYHSEIEKKYSEDTLKKLHDFLSGHDFNIEENNYEDGLDVFIPSNLLALFEMAHSAEIPLEERLFPPRQY